MKFILFLGLVLVFAGCAQTPEKIGIEPQSIEVAYFAGGCFWCMESGFEAQEGVVEVISGYSGGDIENPTYQQVLTGTTGHFEAVQVQYDPSVITYEQLLESFWILIDPTDDGGQFADRGEQYKTAIFFETSEQQQAAEQAKLNTAQFFDDPIVTPIIAFQSFYPAEEYHQDYYLKQQGRYKTYEQLSGRKDFVDANKERFENDLKSRLTPLQYKVTQQDGTEPAFNNKYWDNKEDGIYVDIVSGVALFSSTDKYVSGTGWPSFTKPLDPQAVVEAEDYKLGYKRVELRSALADSHLGHVFTDGPEPAGLRYCMNSAALDFIPKEELEAKGYGKYLELFE